eukprot:CAMPEP_0182496414 /NCGR_PEP_ID=MMETSP1321-20130603/5064_1 /TAXON_ID=91990 /ORGANISM="Bolidomonas sp., Strain RCC1657" /LENGTH=118 /DNA_ID=CAMNT_0024700031 /DNA_START=92 /DNA_END=452 /DNA_ORIENTATION=+
MTHEEHDEVAPTPPPTPPPTPTSTTICVDSEDDLGNGYGFCYEWAEELMYEDLFFDFFYGPGGYSAEEIAYNANNAQLHANLANLGHQPTTLLLHARLRVVFKALDDQAQGLVHGAGS